MFREKRGQGYVGESMSVNAQIAHSNNEMPLSHWTKKRIMEELEEASDYGDLNLNMSLIKKLTKEQLQSLVLIRTSWHHTGALFNQTEFYSLDEGFLTKLTDEIIKEEINKRKEFLEKTKEERAIKKAELEIKREVNKAKKNLKEELEELVKFSNYKTVSGLEKAIDAGRANLEELRKSRDVEAIERAESRFKSVAGQVRKETNYKSVSEMFEDYKAGRMSQEDIDKINSKLMFPEY